MASKTLKVRLSDGRIWLGIARNTRSDTVELLEVDEAYQGERLLRLIWNSAKKGANDRWHVPGMKESTDKVATIAAYGERIAELAAADLKAGSWRRLPFLASRMPA